MSACSKCRVGQSLVSDYLCDEGLPFDNHNATLGAVKEEERRARLRSLREQSALVLGAVLALMIAGCSTSTPHQSSKTHQTSSNHRTLPVPSVTGVAPATGTTAGGTTVTITGSGFLGTTKVAFGEVAAASFMVVSEREIIAVSPAQAPSIQNIHVTTAGGTSQPVVAVDPFTYVSPVLAITGIAPSSGPTAGGTSVTVTGTGFTGATEVVFGSVPATKYTVVSDTEITAISPAQAVGVQNIQVTEAAGTTTLSSAADQFTYVNPASAVTGIAPSSGPTAGGTTVTVTVTGFTGATRVVFGAVPASTYTVVSDTEITVISPAQAAGNRNIVVTVLGGTTTPVVAADRLTYKA
jgi:hypothetical protein